jgi:hypothetical protein
MTLPDETLRDAFTSVAVPSDRDPTAAEIQALVDGDGDERDRISTLARLVATPSGRRELAMMRTLRDAFDASAAYDVTDGTVRSLQAHVESRRAPQWARWVRPFGLAAAVLLVSFVGVQRWRDRDDVSVMRSGAVAVTLLAPGANVNRSDSIRFVWRSVAGATYELEVYSADGAPTVAHTTSDTSFVMSPMTAAAGDYRWWVTAQLDDGTQVRSATRRVVLR